MRIMMTVIRRLMMVQANWDGAVNCPLKSRVLPSVIALLLHCPSYLALVLLIQLTSADAEPAKHCITLIHFICTLYHH